ncbi:tyrosine-type recombinase/integrase [Halobellus salinisoli]|uniref:tyrosine-type recombinase/integrase n=1 Tax=Halobellus salinisoli TaxID=3108500 RepID=UPI003008311A
MTAHRDELEPIDPRTARELYLDHKATHCSEATVQSHDYRTRHIINWCDENDIDNLNELTGRDLHQFRLWHMDRGDINQVTLRQHMCTLRVFLKWAASIEAVPPDLYDKVMVPQVGRGERQRDDMLDAETAQELLQYLEKYHFASRRHIIIALLWETGIRTGAAHSIDLEDVHLDEGYIELVHRSDNGTTLKTAKAVRDRLPSPRTSSNCWMSTSRIHGKTKSTTQVESRSSRVSSDACLETRSAESPTTRPHLVSKENPVRTASTVSTRSVRRQLVLTQFDEGASPTS